MHCVACWFFWSTLRLMHWISHLRERSGWPLDFGHTIIKEWETYSMLSLPVCQVSHACMRVRWNSGIFFCHCRHSVGIIFPAKENKFQRRLAPWKRIQRRRIAPWRQIELRPENKFRRRTPEDSLLSEGEVTPRRRIPRRRFPIRKLNISKKQILKTGFSHEDELCPNHEIRRWHPEGETHPEDTIRTVIRTFVASGRCTSLSQQMRRRKTTVPAVSAVSVCSTRGRVRMRYRKHLEENENHS